MEAYSSAFSHKQGFIAHGEYLLSPLLTSSPVQEEGRQSWGCNPYVTLEGVEI
jgi:hypothetical protein